jgi:imidazolonepropionase
MIDLVIQNASQILTCAPEEATTPKAGRQQGTLSITSGGVAIKDGRILEVGPEVDRLAAESVIDAGGGVILPGFVDCHTHSVFAGSRAEEFEERARGVSYQEIAKRGGGIRSSMTSLREASDEELEAAVGKHLDRFLELGTTTIEAKSGYGLSLDDELRALRALGIPHEVEVLRTCLAAHTVPPEFADDRDAYLDLVCNKIFPAVADEELAKYCDAFIEQGVFSFAEGERVFEAGKRYGLRPRVHAEQLSHAGGIKLACRVGAVSADHLEFCTKEDAVAMKQAGVMAVLLPTANYTLDQEKRAPARSIISVGCPIALATDFNPGSSPTQSMPLVLNMACVRFGMSVAEAIVGATFNAACAIEQQHRLGSIEAGKQADLIVCDVSEYREIAYFFGGNPVRTVVKRGKVVRE